MGKTDRPRSGSMAFWPRVRAKKLYARIKSFTKKPTDKVSLLGFACYKVGMTHIIGTDNRKTAFTKGEQISFPVTILECPPIKIFAARFYKKNAYGLFVEKDFLFKSTKELAKKIDLPKKFPDIKELDDINLDDCADITAICYTQPKMTGFARKKPELFELKLNGSNKEKLEFIKSYSDKEMPIDSLFSEGELVDIHGITTGRGTCGPVKRFGIALKSHRSEKGVRRPGSIAGGWKAQQHMMYRVAFSGQHGFHQRIQYNSQILKIGSNPEEVNPKDGFSKYGKVKSTYLLLKGSVMGPKKRTIIITKPMRPQKNLDAIPTIREISLQSKQGR